MVLELVLALTLVAVWVLVRVQMAVRIPVWILIQVKTAAVMHQKQRPVRAAPHEGKKVQFSRGGRRAHVHVGDQHVRAPARQMRERPHDAPEAFPALGGPDLLVVIGVQKPDHDHQRTGDAGKETGELRGDRRLGLERGERPGDVCAVEGVLRVQPQERGQPRNEITVEAHRPVDDRDRPTGRTPQEQGGGVDRRMAVQQMDRRGEPAETTRGGVETGEGPETGRFVLSEMYWRMHREDRRLFFRMIRHICRIVKSRTINMSSPGRPDFGENG